MRHGSERGCETCGRSCSRRFCSRECRHRHERGRREPAHTRDDDVDPTELSTAELCERYGLPYGGEA